MLKFKTQDFEAADDMTNLWVYNGLDTCLTFEIIEKLRPLFNDNTRAIYKWEFSAQAVALEMMFRGFRVDREQVHKIIEEAQIEYDHFLAMLNQMAEAVWDAPLNPNSPAQLKKFIYEAFGLDPVVYRGKVSTDRKSLEKCMETNLFIRPIAKLILLLHDLGKTISVLKSEIDSDNRLRTSYSVAGTETGRWNSSMNAFGGGTNMQNITNQLRKVFIADPGKKLAYIDLQAAESKAVGYISEDPAYIDLCDHGDAHTAVARLVWTDLPWTGDIKKDKEIANNTPFYRSFSVRDMAKKGGHGTNYYGTPKTMAGHLKMPVDTIAEFQHKYFTAFPNIPVWHKKVIQAIQLEHKITTCFGRERLFFGRASDASTWREAIAFEPQSTIADTLNFAAWRVQRRWQGKTVELLAQVHDAIVVQYPEELEDELLPEILQEMIYPIPIHGRTMIIGVDAETGWNWCHFNPKNPAENPDGIKKYKGHDDRTRQNLPHDNFLDWKLD
jgi:DNA polymerase-1